jgi:hypothetical protein
VCFCFQVASYGTQFVCNIIFIFIFKLWYPICNQVFFQIILLWGGGVYTSAKVYKTLRAIVRQLLKDCFFEKNSVVVGIVGWLLCTWTSVCGVFHYDLFFFFFQVQNWDLVFHKELDFVQMERLT